LKPLRHREANLAGLVVGTFLALAGTVTAGFAGPTIPRTPEAPFVVAIDAGHGGTATPDPEQLFDPGSSAFGLAEKDLTLDLAKRLDARLTAERIQTFMTRTQDEFLTIGERVRRVQAARADALISIHINAYAPDPTAGGTVMLYPREASAGFARTIGAQLTDALQAWQIEDGGAVLKTELWSKLEIPTVTVEPAYLTNPREADLLKRDDFKDAIVGGLVTGLIAAFPDLERVRITALHPPPLTAQSAPGPAAAANSRSLPAPRGERELRSLWPAALILIALLLAPRVRQLFATRPDDGAILPRRRRRSIAEMVYPVSRAWGQGKSSRK
jgi:N-acetylmuramoyl-L-alanine amidase